MTKRVIYRGQRHRRMLIATAGLAALGHGALAYGTAYTWLGTSGNNWSSTVNWSSNGVQTAPPLTPAAGDTTDLVWTGNLAANVTSTQNTGTIVVDSMTFNFTPTGAATLQISGSSTSTQAIMLGAGGINMTAGGTVAFASSANRLLFLTADQTWTNTNTSAIMAMRRAVSGDFKITKEGAGTVSFEAADPDFTGGIDINNGVIRLANFSNAIGVGTITSVTDNPTGISASGSTEAQQTVAGQVVLGGAGTFSLSGSWLIDLHNTVTLQNDKVINVGGLSTLATGTQGRVISGNIIGPGGLFKSGGGTLILTNAGNDYAGNTAVYNGVLSVGSLGQLGTGTTVILGDFQPGSGTTTINDGTLQITNANEVTTRAFSINAGGGNLDFAGDLTINNTITGTGPLTKVGAGNLNVNAVRIGGALTSTTGTLKINAGGGDAGTSSATALVLGGGTGAWTSALDLTDHGFVVDYAASDASPMPQVVDQIMSGRAGGSWNGNGINSSTVAADSSKGIGYAEASQALGTNGGTFAGQSVDGSAVLVRSTFNGDNNLDGKVDLTDFTFLAANFNTQSGATWLQGDYNYDGKVDLTDFTFLAGNFNKSLSAPAAGASLGQAVPEPTSIAVVLSAVGGVATLTRRRRRRQS